MQKLLERRPKLETLPGTSTRTRLGRAALKLFEIIPHPLKQGMSAHETPAAATGKHHIKDRSTDLTTKRLQEWLTVEERRKDELDPLPSRLPHQKQTMYELATKDQGNHVLVAPDPETSKVIAFPSKDEALLNSIHKDQRQ